MKRFFIIVSFFIVLASMTFKTKAQSIDFSQYNSWAAGIKFGLLPFYGDVRQLHYSAENKYKKTNTAFTFELIKNFNHVFGAKLNVMTGGLSGSSDNLNIHFNSNLLETTLSGIININDLVGIYPTKNKVINTYLFAGAGIVSFRSKAYSFNEDSYITGYGWDSTGYSKTPGRNEYVFPLGIGFKFNADEKFDIGLEFTLHLTNTDKMDAWMVGNSYNDRYSYAAISFTYKIGTRAEYVDWISPYQDTTLANILLARNKSDEPVEKTNISVVSNNNVTNSNQNVTENNSGIVELKYFIISGTYTSKKLAKDAADRLISKGYPNANYFLQKSTGNWRVYYKGYATLDAALADWVGLKKTNSYAKLLEKKEKESYSDITVSYKNYIPVVNDTAKTQNKTNVVTNNTNTTNNTTVNNTNNTNTSNNTNTNNNNNTNSNTNNNSNTSNNTNNTSTSNNSDTTSNTSTNNTTNTTTNNTNTTTVVKKFFIIAGSFATEELAKEGIAELKAKGFIYAEVVGKNDYGSYRIAYKGYATREEANTDLPTIKQNTNPSAWIFEKK